MRGWSMQEAMNGVCNGSFKGHLRLSFGPHKGDCFPTSHASWLSLEDYNATQEDYINTIVSLQALPAGTCLVDTLEDCLERGLQGLVQDVGHARPHATPFISLVALLPPPPPPTEKAPHVMPQRSVPTPNYSAGLLKQTRRCQLPGKGGKRCVARAHTIAAQWGCPAHEQGLW